MGVVTYGSYERFINQLESYRICWFANAINIESFKKGKKLYVIP